MKAWYQSKMVWLGVIQTIIGILLIVQDFIASGKAFDIAGIVMIVIGALQVILRIWFTDTAIG